MIGFVLCQHTAFLRPIARITRLFYGQHALADSLQACRACGCSALLLLCTVVAFRRRHRLFPPVQAHI
jgi:xanthine/uracil permease